MSVLSSMWLSGGPGLRRAVLACGLGLTLGACVTAPSSPPARPSPPVPAPTQAGVPAAVPAAAPAPAPPDSPGALALREGVGAFELGEYRRAELRLADSLKLGLISTEEQVRAHKTQAFLFCITRRTPLCEKAFEAAFAADRKFDLSRAERGHPIWGPVFLKVLARQGG